MEARTFKITDATRGSAIGCVSAAPEGWSFSVKPPGRTLDQNATLHMWFGEIAQQQTDLDANEVKGMCHRRWGLDIRLREPAFAWLWARTGAGLSYEKQCKFLASGVLNISSGMTTPQLGEYMDAMFRHFKADGLHLTDPEIRKYEVMA